MSEHLQGRKASEVFLEYADPFLRLGLEQLGRGTLEQIEQILQIPWTIWNACILQNDPNQKVDFMASIRLLLRRQPGEAKLFIEQMKERKKMLFAKYNYLLGKMTLTADEQTGGLTLILETRLPPSAK
jgi:hypothetical protein